MADAQEDAPAAPAEESQQEAQQEDAAPTEEAAPAEAAPVEGEAAPEEGAAQEAEAPTEAPPAEEGGATEEAPADQEAAEGKSEGGEGEADSGEGEAKTEEQATSEGQEEGEKKEGEEGGEEAAEQAAVEDGSVEQVEGAEPAEGGEGAEPSQQAEEEAGNGEKKEEEEEQATEAKEGGEEGERAEKEGEGGEDGEKKEGEEGESAVEGEEKKEGEEEEQKEEPKEGEEATEEAAVDGDAVKDEEDHRDSPVAVGEKLSRGGTPDVPDGAVTMDQERLEATTPDRLDEDGQEMERVLREQEMVEEEEEEEEDEDEMEEPAFKREELIERYHEALAEREQLQQQNYGLQHRLAEYFRKKKADERQDYDKNVTDQEQRYLKYMAQLEDLRRQDAMEKDNFRAQIEDAKTKCQEKKEKVDVERKKFMEFKKQVALNAINSRSGKPIPPKDIEQYMVNEVKKEQEVIVVRLENIKLKNKLKKKEQQLKSKEELAEGLHLIDFEQLKIENQTYNEKIEERNEELLKLRKKITGTVQVLTHLKEKLQFVQGENTEQNDQLKEVEATLAQSRDILSRTKQARDALRIDNQKLRQNCGLLGNEPLLRDFEERKDEGDDLRAKLEQLKMKHAELTLHCNQVRRKIDQARQAVV